MLTNSDQRYGLVSRGLHWTVAVLIIGLLALGWYMVDLNYYHRWYNAALEGHKSLGMLALLAGAMHVVWAAVTRAPAPPACLAPWERLSARAVHVTFFAMMVAIPVTGYIISTSSGDSVSIFGWFEVPALLPEHTGLRDLAIELHYYLAYATAILALLHALAAFKHQFLDRDGTLRRMI